MSRKETSEKNRKAVHAFKQSLNPVTGEIYTYADISAMLKITRQAAFRYAGDTSGCCPNCLRPLVKIKLPKIK